MRIGIIGTGHLAELVVRGLEGTQYRAVLSPRGADTAARLADVYGCEVAETNQAVVDRAEGVFVALPAALGLQELSRLRFRPGQPVLSAMAGIRVPDLATAVGPAEAAVTMMPGYANALKLGPSILFPHASFWQRFLVQLGPVHVVETEETFTAAAAFGAFSGATFLWMETVINWFANQGVPADLARSLIAETLRGNAEVVRSEPGPIQDISQSVATPGGITQTLLDALDKGGGLQAWASGLDAVAKRLSPR